MHLVGPVTEGGMPRFEARKVAAELISRRSWCLGLIYLISQLRQLSQLRSVRSGVVLGFSESKQTVQTTPPVKNMGEVYV